MKRKRKNDSRYIKIINWHELLYRLKILYTPRKKNDKSSISGVYHNQEIEKVLENKAKQPKPDITIMKV